MFNIMMLVLLIIPSIMLVFGLIWRDNYPKKINRIYGYRTSMSMKNMETWEYAHRYQSRILLLLGRILFPLTILVLIVNRKDYENPALVLLIVQLIALLVSIIPTEKALRKKFDRDGNRKE